MILQKAKKQLRIYFPHYLIALLAVFGLKLFYSRAGSDELTWILTPTARWVSILSGIPFTYESGSGYVNHSLRFVIAPSCCGVQFMCVSTAMLIFSFVHRADTRPGRRAFLWTVGSLVFSYLYTIFTNGLRILLSIYIPLYLSGTAIYRGPLTPERLHTLIGTAVYFALLLTLYRLAGLACRRVSSGTLTCSVSCFLSPLFWYFFIVLGVPFLNRAYFNHRRQFTEYALLVTVVCLILLFMSGLLHQLITFPQKIKRPFPFHGILKSRYRKRSS